MTSRILVASANAGVGLADAWAVLEGGGTALDAAEAAVRRVEDNPDDHTVGYGGYPNLLGEVELDASIMDGVTRQAGAVGALSGYRHAITVARAVMERTPHVFLAGEGAARLAHDLGMPQEELRTPDVERIWRDGIEGKLEAGSFGAGMLARVAELVRDPERIAGTVNVIARDSSGGLAVAVSTSGWAWKHPGRLGDSPVIGAGNYADARFGAAACTGFGELALRAGTAGAIVGALARGVAIDEACAEALRDLAALGGVDAAEVVMHVVALDATGKPCGATTQPGAEFLVQSGAMSEPELRPRTVVELQAAT
jgi:beta-aspartyl-peptidase (threonine type)